MKLHELEGIFFGQYYTKTVTVQCGVMNFATKMHLLYRQNLRIQSETASLQYLLNQVCLLFTFLTLVLVQYSFLNTY